LSFKVKAKDRFVLKKNVMNFQGKIFSKEGSYNQYDVDKRITQSKHQVATFFHDNDP
jgi:hypothetical protein